MKKITIIILVILFFNENTYAGKRHKILVLPYEVNIQGKIPKELDSLKLSQLKQELSYFYQSEMIAAITYYKNKHRNRKVQLDILSASEINKILKDKNIDEAQINNMSLSEINRIFPNQKVLRGTLHKHILISDATALGINYGVALVNTVIAQSTIIPNTNNKQRFWGLPGVNSQINNMIVHLENSETSSVDWSKAGSNYYTSKRLLRYFKRNQ